ncbi:MAG: class I SAM-dependent methyltransferase [Legionella sp.]
MSNILLTVGFDDLKLRAEAEQLATKLELQLNNDYLPRLSLGNDKLQLLSHDFLPIAADFNASRWQKRRDAGKKQGLIRACKPKEGVFIIDATAGWGRDSAILASFGARILMLERNKILAALLDDALQRRESNTLDLSLQHVDAKDYIQALNADDYPDIIYIDPMHPVRNKNALVKKDMQILQNFLGPDEDARELIDISISRARQRVVVKWPQHLNPLIKPQLSITGKTVRFDVYLLR